MSKGGKYRQEYSKAFCNAFTPRPILTGSEWADAYRYVAPGTSPEPGEWRTDRVPYLREPMDKATDQETEIVVLCCSSQVGKSEALLNIMGYYASQEPAPMLMLQPTLGMAQAFSKERVDPTFRFSKGLNDKLIQAKDESRGTSRKTGATILMKTFPGGYLALVGANSPAGLASRPIRVLLADEVDRYGTTKEGDPLKLAIQRTTNFHNRKIIMVSTPTITGASEIESWFLRSDQRRFVIPCQHCGTFEAWTWQMVRWDRDENGVADVRTSRIECPHCGEIMRGSGRPDPLQIAMGHWEATRESMEGIVGYHLNSLISPWVNLDSLVAEFVTANENRDKQGLQEFINLKLGEAWDDNSTSEDVGAMVHRRREYYAGDIPIPVCLLTAGVDVQRDRLECTIIGWGMGIESWVIRHIIIPGDPLGVDVWSELDAVLLKPYEHELFGQLQIMCTCVDSGDGITTEAVYRYTKPREPRRVYSSKGRGGDGVPFVSKPNRVGRYKAALYTLGVDAGKSIVTSRLQLQDEGPGYVHIPRETEKGCGQEYCLQLGAERLKQKFEKGRTTRKWQAIRERNEALDCMVMATAALQILGINMDDYARMMIESGGKPVARRPQRAKGKSVF